MFGDAIVEPEQIRDTSVALAQANFLDANLLYQKLQSKSGWTKAMRTHERGCEIQDNFGIMDFSLKAKSRQCKDTDQAYFQQRQDSTVWTNVREGNSLLVEHNPDEDNRVSNVTFLRQGLPKIFNLSSDAVHSEKHASIPKDDEQAYYHYDTLAQVRKALMEGSQVEVVRSLKTNGDGACVTWAPALNAWIITSENVSIAARNENDVKTLYPEQTRYFLARKIALCWFRRVNQIKKQGTAKLDALKQDLTRYVFVGDFIGNKDLINLIKYPRETICFHSVVVKDRTAETAQSTSYCEANSFALLKRHHLDVVPSRQCGIYSSY